MKHTAVSSVTSVQSSKMDAKKKLEDDSDRPKKKSTRYNDSNLDLGFTFIPLNGEQKPRSVICSKVLASESMLLNKLKRHLGLLYRQFVNKLIEVFVRKLNNLKKQVSTISQFTHLPSKTFLASYQVAHRIAKCKKSHTIAEELILPAAVDIATTMIGVGAAQKLKLVLLSNDTMCHWIDDMAEDIHYQLIDQKKERELRLQVHEANANSRGAHCTAHLLCSVC